MLRRDEAELLLAKYLKTENLLKHSFAVEEILRRVAIRLHEDAELWALTGLLHDLDYDFTKNDPVKHASMSPQILEGLLPEEAVNAIKAHNYQHTMQVPETVLDKALIAADAVSGLIIATALVVPSKKLDEVKVKTLKNKYKDTSFARGCNRKRIDLCEDVDIPVDEFLELSLNALRDIAGKLGL
jgi:putative nucleotidyltransferase with HDIG domain